MRQSQAMKTSFLSVLQIVFMHGIVTAADDPLPSWNDGAVKTNGNAGKICSIH